MHLDFTGFTGFCFSVTLFPALCRFSCRAPNVCSRPHGSYSGVFQPAGASMNGRTCKSLFISVALHRVHVLAPPLGFAYSLLSEWTAKADPHAAACTPHPLHNGASDIQFRCVSSTWFLNIPPGQSDSDCASLSVNSSCVLAKCRQHSAFLADAFSPAVECKYQRGVCAYEVNKFKAKFWPVLLLYAVFKPALFVP